MKAQKILNGMNIFLCGAVIGMGIIIPLKIECTRLQKELDTVKSDTWELKTQIWRLENGKKLEGIDLIPTVTNIKRSLKKKTFGKI